MLSKIAAGAATVLLASCNPAAALGPNLINVPWKITKIPYELSQTNRKLVKAEKETGDSNAENIAANNELVNQNQAGLDKHSKQIANNTESSKANAKAIAKTEEQVKTNAGHIANNTSDINQIWANTETARRSTQATLQNQQRIGNQINNNSNRIGNLEHRMDKMKDDIDSALTGAALSIAIASAPLAVDQNSSYIAMGAGSYKGHNGIAMSLSHRFERVTVSGSVGYSESSAGLGVGVGYSF